MECIEFAKAHNIGIEIKSFSSPMIFQSDWHGLLEIIKKQLKNFDGKKSLHALYPVSHFNWNRMSIQQLKSDYEKTLIIADELNARNMVVHSTYIPGLTSWKYKDWLDNQIDLWGYVARKAQEFNIEVLIENIVDEKPACILDIINELKLSNLQVCLDFGHLNLIPTQLSNLDWVNAVEKHLTYVHVHNNNGRYDSHSSLDNGIIDFNQVFERLLGFALTPKVAIETSSLTGVKESLDFINKIVKDRLPIS